MKKIMIGVMVGIFVLVGLVSGMMTIITDTPENYAQSEQYERYNVEIQVNKGWNLIASGFIFDKELDYLDESGDIKKENIKVVYVYSNKINELTQAIFQKPVAEPKTTEPTESNVSAFGGNTYALY